MNMIAINTAKASAKPKAPVVEENNVQLNSHELNRHVIECMEQGILVWSAAGHCEMFNERAYDVLELSPTELYIGISRVDLLKNAVARGEMSKQQRDNVQARFERAQPFSFDRLLPSKRVVATTARPMEKGGYVVTFTDVTEARKQQSELVDAKQSAELAETKAREALRIEQERKRENRLLSELGEWLQSCKSLDELFRVISRFMSRLFPGTLGELYVYSNSRDVLDGACQWNSTSINEHIQPDDCWSLRRGRMYKFGAGLVDFKCSHVPKSEASDEDVSEQDYLCIPIIAHGDTVGLLHIRFIEERSNDNMEQPFLEQVQSFALRCSEQISLAIANVKLRDELRDQSTKDPLTGLFNRRYFMETCRRTFSMAERVDAPVGMIFFDADNFKTFNDNHGHDAGDIVLRSIAEVMHKLFSEDETVCRFGGEEFTILLPDKTLEETAKIAEKLRARVEKMTVRYRDNDLPKATISVGVAAYPVSGSQIHDVINAADDAVYRAKAMGKNRVSLDKDMQDQIYPHTSTSLKTEKDN